jgi:hypothetical protein
MHKWLKKISLIIVIYFFFCHMCDNDMRQKLNFEKNNQMCRNVMSIIYLIIIKNPRKGCLTNNRV